jgi:hypothetical protein
LLIFTSGPKKLGIFTSGLIELVFVYFRTYKYTVECVNKDLKSDEEFSDTCSPGDIHAPLFGLINMDTTSDEEREPFHKVDIFSECIGRGYYFYQNLNCGNIY